MHPLLKKALERLGLKSFNDLNELEQETFKQWEETLERGGEITSPEVLDGIKDMFEETLTKLEDENLAENAKTFLLCQMKVLKYIIRTIESPKSEVKKVESEISSLIRKQ